MIPTHQSLLQNSEFVERLLAELDSELLSQLDSELFKTRPNLAALATAFQQSEATTQLQTPPGKSLVDFC